MKRIALVLSAAFILILFAGCGGTSSSQASPSPVNATASAQASPESSLKGKELFIYAGAGMKSPVDKLIAAFEADTGAKVHVTYANAANIVTQITTSKEGDVFIAGASTELAPLKEKGFIANSMDLVKHIPVLAVQKGNRKNIHGLSDLAQKGVSVILGDNKATPIGKLADQALTAKGILKSVNVISRTATANEMTTALTLKQCDAVIIWKENIANVDKAEIVKTSDLDSYIKTVPAASLTCSKNTEATAAFLSFLASEKAHTIWQSCGYELIS